MRTLKNEDEVAVFKANCHDLHLIMVGVLSTGTLLRELVKRCLFRKGPELNKHYTIE